MPRVSVIIATKNRSKELKTISLPSLSKQDFKDFEVIVWDASDDDSSKKVVEEFEKEHLDMDIKYFKAPRIGSSSQRNDAVKVAKGEIVFFIDDDSEVSKDGLEAISNAFKEHEEIVGTALPIGDEHYSKNSRNCIDIFKSVRNLFSMIFFLDHQTKESKVYLSGHCGNQFKKPGYVVHLTGCDMAFKRNVFEDHKFCEKLQKFGGYALYEDLQLTQKLYREGGKLFITNHGHVLHRAAKGERAEKSNFIAMTIYNNFVVWKTAVYPFKKYSIFPYIWSLIGLIMLYFLKYLRHPRRRKYILEGMKMGIKAIISSNRHGEKVVK